jgi:hypothetical protein
MNVDIEKPISKFKLIGNDAVMEVNVTKMDVDIEKPTLKLNLIADSSGFLRTCSEVTYI